VFCVKEISPEEYDKTSLASPQYSLFTTSKWLGMWETRYFGCFKGNELLGALALWNGVSGGTSHPFTPWSGIVENVTGGQAHRLSYIADMMTAFIITLDIKSIYFHPSWVDMRPFKWNGRQVDIRYTMIVPMEGAWDNLEKQMRYRINHYTDTHKVDGYDKFWELYQQTFYEQNLNVPCDRKFYDGLMKFNPLVLTTDKSGVLILLNDDTAYFLMGAGDDSVCLLWKAIEILQGARIEKLDLVGCNQPGIARYKTGMGGNLIAYYGMY
jgi:hypothetical protein